MKRALVIVGTLLLGSLAFAGQAHADPPPLPGSPTAQKTDTAGVNGASATCTVPVDLAAIACTVKDTAADKHSVFVEYKDTSGRSYRFDNHDNANAERTFVNDSLWKGADRSKLQWRVCVNLRLDKDRCSKYVNYSVGANPQSFDLDCDVDAATCNQLANLPADGGWQLSRACLASAAWTAIGLDKDGLGRVGRFLLKKVPGAGWAVSAGDVAIVVAGCR